MTQHAMISAYDDFRHLCIRNVVLSLSEWIMAASVDSQEEVITTTGKELLLEACMRTGPSADFGGLFP